MIPMRTLFLSLLLLGCGGGPPEGGRPVHGATGEGTSGAEADRTLPPGMGLPPPDALRFPVPVDGAPGRGAAEPLVTIVQFSDFECPFCSEAQETLARLVAHFPNEVRVVFRHNPLARHPHAELAAQAAMEAYAQGGEAAFWKMHDLLFANQDHLTRADLEEYAKAAGLDLERFKRALDEGIHLEAIRRDQDLARENRARGTPGHFVNGRPIMGAHPYEEFVGMIHQEMALARKLLKEGVPRTRLYEATLEATEASPDDEAAARHILIQYRGAERAGPDITRAKEEARALAEKVRALALAEGADFAALARKYSDGPSGPNGGDIGHFGRGMMVPEFERAVFALEKGGVSEVVESQFGFHVIQRYE